MFPSLSILIFTSIGLILSTLSLFMPFPVGILLSNTGLHFFDPMTTLAIVGFFFTLGNIAKLLVFRNHLNWKLFRALLPGTLIGGLIITYLLTFVPEKVIIGILLFFALSYVIKNLFAKKKASSPASEVSGFIAGLATGMLSAVGGPGGTLRGAYLVNHITSLQELNGITASISLVSGIANTFFRVSTWDISWSFVVPLLFSFPLLLALTYFGKTIMDRLNWKPRTIQLITNTAVLISLVFAVPTLFR